MLSTSPYSIMFPFPCPQGPVKLSVPDDRELDYTQYFVQASVSKLMSAHTDPDQLTVPASLTTDLTIRVDFAGVVSKFLKSSHCLLSLLMSLSQGCSIFQWGMC
jgi:hypothetical protein